jgi:hypothetical protein
VYNILERFSFYEPSGIRFLTWNPFHEGGPSEFPLTLGVKGEKTPIYEPFRK